MNEFDMAAEKADFEQVEAQERRTPDQQELRELYCSKEGRDATMVWMITTEMDDIAGRLHPHPEIEGFFELVVPRQEKEGYAKFTCVQLGPEIVVPGQERLLGLVVVDDE